MNSKEKLVENIRILKKYQDEHPIIGKKMVDADNGTFYYLDFLATAVLNRSQSLIAGFCAMVEAKNFICAAPLIRLQLDNCLRFYAASIVDNPHKFARSILKGIPVREMKDKNNKLMSDNYLSKKLSDRYSWVLRLYKESSGHIHLSEKHIFSCITDTADVSGSKKTVSFAIGSESSGISDEIYYEASEAFKVTTEVLFEYINGWIYTKDNPEKVEKLKNKVTT